MSTSERINSQQRDLQIYGPFYKILFINSLIPNNYLGVLSSSIYLKLKTRRSDQTLFYYGRQLWGSILAHSNSDTVKKMAENKILFGINWESISSKFFPFISVIVRENNIIDKLPSQIRIRFNFSILGDSFLNKR